MADTTTPSASSSSNAFSAYLQGLIAGLQNNTTGNSTSNTPTQAQGLNILPLLFGQGSNFAQAENGGYSPANSISRGGLDWFSIILGSLLLIIGVIVLAFKSDTVQSSIETGKNVAKTAALLTA